MNKTIFIVILLFLTCLLAQDKPEQKMVTIRFDISHNIQPAISLPLYTASIIYKHKPTEQIISDGQQLFPGEYNIIIRQPGYKWILCEVNITEDMDVFLVRKTLIAKKRIISLKMVDPATGLSVKPLAVINLTPGEKSRNIKEVETKKNFVYDPDQRVFFKVKFAKYKTQEVSPIVVPGEGLQIIPIGMVKLRPLDFIGRPPLKIVLDGIEYPKTFYIDNKKLEDHLDKTINGDPEDPENSSRIYHTFLIPPYSKILQIYEGYFYTDMKVDFNQQDQVTYRADHISIKRLIVHLKRIGGKKDNPRLIILESIEEIIKKFRNRKMLKACSHSERKQLIDFLESQRHIEDSQTYDRFNVVIEKIRKIN